MLGEKALCKAVHTNVQRHVDGKPLKGSTSLHSASGEPSGPAGCVFTLPLGYSHRKVAEPPTLCAPRSQREVPGVAQCISPHSAEGGGKLIGEAGFFQGLKKLSPGEICSPASALVAKKHPESLVARK